MEVTIMYLYSFCLILSVIHFMLQLADSIILSCVVYAIPPFIVHVNVSQHFLLEFYT